MWRRCVSARPQRVVAAVRVFGTTHGARTNYSRKQLNNKQFVLAFSATAGRSANALFSAQRGFFYPTLSLSLPLSLRLCVALLSLFYTLMYWRRFNSAGINCCCCFTTVCVFNFSCNFFPQLESDNKKCSVSLLFVVVSISARMHFRIAFCARFTCFPY